MLEDLLLNVNIVHTVLKHGWMRHCWKILEFNLSLHLILVASPTPYISVKITFVATNHASRVMVNIMLPVMNEAIKV